MQFEHTEKKIKMRDQIRSSNSLSAHRGANSAIYQRFEVGEIAYAPIENGVIMQGKYKTLFKPKAIKSTYIAGAFRFYETDDGFTFAETLEHIELYKFREAIKMALENPEIYCFEL